MDYATHCDIGLHHHLDGPHHDHGRVQGQGQRVRGRRIRHGDHLDHSQQQAGMVAPVTISSKREPIHGSDDTANDIVDGASFLFDPSSIPMVRHTNGITHPQHAPIFGSEQTNSSVDAGEWPITADTPIYLL